MQATVEEVIGAGHDDDRQVERLRPVEDIGERHGFVGRAVDDDGVVRHGFGVVLAGAFD